ncbi:hypothetical protein GCM10010219_62650 [Streptomyces netropsis]|nr:hypothetical protein GCM10010219_62650 [Streptomyces netropsis]
MVIFLMASDDMGRLPQLFTTVVPGARRVMTCAANAPESITAHARRRRKSDQP